MFEQKKESQCLWTLQSKSKGGRSCAQKENNRSYRISKAQERDLEFILSTWKPLEMFELVSTINPQVLFRKMTVSFAKGGQSDVCSAAALRLCGGTCG